MTEQLQPSRPGYDLSVADLARVRIGPEETAKIILQHSASGKAPDATVLLANLNQQQQFNNCQYLVYPFNLPLTVLPIAGTKIQILPQNPYRKFLHLSIDANTATRFSVILEEGPPAIENLDAATLNNLLRSGVQWNAAAFGTAGNITNPFLIAPINAVTLVGETSVTLVRGIVIEGV